MSAKTNKWVACWGYDQTQYSVYEEVSRKGQFVIVRGINSWSSFSDRDLCAGSKVKVYVPMGNFYDYTPELRAEIANRENWNAEQAQTFDGWQCFARNYNKEREEKAPVRTIVKVKHEKTEYGKSWIWEMGNGEIIKQSDRFAITIVDGLTRRKINTPEWSNTPNIRIDSVIRAHLDENYDKNAEKYAEQNEYTMYNGR